MQKRNRTFTTEEFVSDLNHAESTIRRLVNMVVVDHDVFLYEMEHISRIVDLAHSLNDAALKHRRYGDTDAD